MEMCQYEGCSRLATHGVWGHDEDGEVVMDVCKRHFWEYHELLQREIAEIEAAVRREKV